VTGSTLPLAPETTTVSGPGAYAAATTSPPTAAQPAGQDSYWPWAVPTKPVTPDHGYVHGQSPLTVVTVRERATTPDFDEWLHHVRAAAACRHPIRLSGQIDVRDRAGSVIATVDTADMPDGAIYTPCGNRRAAVCPACAEVYRRDTYHLIKAGLTGDRWGIPPLHEHIAVFVTATAPSFGPVHHRLVDVHAADCRTKDRCTCRAKICHPFGRSCPHGVPTACRTRHKATDPALGQPLCLDCYNHAAHVVWNHEAPELWRRTIQNVRRNIERLGRALGVELRRCYVKVYEFQVRGVIHYHALIRLDGVHPDCPQAIVPPPRAVTRTMLEAAVRAAFTGTAYTSPAHSANGDRGWRIGWGDKGLDIQHVNAPGGPINLEKLTGYLAKYVTKHTEVTGLALRRADQLVIDHTDPDTHVGRLLRACWTLGADPAWWRLRRYAHQYGHGGHITTKSRGFSVTYGYLREQRTIWRRTDGHPHLWDDQQADLVVYRLGYHATGWITTGDALLANTAADQARKRAQAGRDALHDDLAMPQPLAA